jgi:hypothetical protein
MRGIFAITTALVILSSLLAKAEEPRNAPEARRHRNVCAAGPVTLANVEGGVLLSRGGSFSEIREGARLSLGDRILVRDGSANVVLGKEVVIRATSGSMVTITVDEGVACATQASLHPAVVGQAATSGIPPIIAVAGVVAVTAAGIGVGVSAANSSNNNNQDQQNAALLLLQSLSQ